MEQNLPYPSQYRPCTMKVCRATMQTNNVRLKIAKFRLVLEMIHLEEMFSLRKVYKFR